MEAVVEHCFVDKKYFDIQKKENFLDNDRLLEHIVYQDVMNIVKNAVVESALVFHVNNNKMKSSTSASRSYPLGNTKKNRISQTTSNNQKNKVEDHPRSVNSNKTNRVIEPVCNANVKHSMLNANSELIYATCNEEAFATNNWEKFCSSYPRLPNILAARRNQERVKSILLLAICELSLLKVSQYCDAKFTLEAINIEICQLEVHGAPISKEDINQKFLRSLPSSWNQIALIMRNKPDIDEIDIDDLYNNLRVYEDELKRSLGSNSASQNLAFLSSENTGSTNEVSTASGDFEFYSSCTTNNQSSTLRMRICSRRLDGDDLEEKGISMEVAMLDIQQNDILLENVDLEGVKEEDLMVTMAGAMHKQLNLHHHIRWLKDGLGGYDWSNDFGRSIKMFIKCLESFKCLQKNYDTEREKHNKAKLEIRGYEIALESLESRIIGHEKNELAWGKKYEFQNYELKCREIKINNLNLELEKAVKERDELKDKIAKWEESTKNLEEILKVQ
ncbi:hypothetical protein Tco_0391175 [Tanacetum coccineum]